MTVIEVEFIEAVAMPGARVGGRQMDSRWHSARNGNANNVSCKLFGPGFVFETETDAVVVPWANVRWVKVDKETLPKR